MTTTNNTAETPAADAVILLSFGGPRRPEDVMPFLRRVTAGRGVPDERLAVVAEHYYERGGASPINEHTEALAEALRASQPLPVYVGNRNWDPFLADAFRAAHADGHRRLLVLTTSAYSSYSGCRQYRENIAAALTELGDLATDLTVAKIAPYYTTDGFITANADAIKAVAPQHPYHVLFVTHSIPTSQAATSGVPDDENPDTGGAYVRQHREAATRIVENLTTTTGFTPTWDLVYCSRSGAPHHPWLTPDINDRLRELAGGSDTGEGSALAGGTDATPRAIVAAPIGFVSDHMEVIQDLDTEAAHTAAEVGLDWHRAATVGTHPAFVAALTEYLNNHHIRSCPTTCCVNQRHPQTEAACSA